MTRSFDEFRRVCVIFESRPDGGLRVYSDDVPGFVLSHPDRDAVMNDIVPALETIIAAMVGRRVAVRLSGEPPASRAFDRSKAEYETRLAA